MEQEIELKKIATKDSYWLDCIEQGIHEGVSIEENIEIQGYAIATNVAIGLVKIKDLRKMTKWANVLDGNATNYSGGDISILTGADLEEAVARRFAHHSLKAALKSNK